MKTPLRTHLKRAMNLVALICSGVIYWFFLTWGMGFSYNITDAVQYKDGPSEQMARIAISLTDTGIININSRDSMEETPLQEALIGIENSRGNKLREGADPGKQERLIADLLQHGADPCLIYQQGDTTIQRFQEDTTKAWFDIPKPQAERLIAMMQAATGGSCPVGGRK
jgi:hypothetical protein